MSEDDTSPPQAAILPLTPDPLHSSRRSWLGSSRSKTGPSAAVLPPPHQQQQKNHQRKSESLTLSLDSPPSGSSAPSSPSASSPPTQLAIPPLPSLSVSPASPVHQSSSSPL